MKKLIVPILLLSVIVGTSFAQLKGNGQETIKLPQGGGDLVSSDVRKSAGNEMTLAQIPRKGTKIVRPPEGGYLVPSDLKMSAEDKNTFVNTAKEIGDEFGSIAYTDDKGLLQIEGKACLTEFRQVGNIMQVNMEPTRVRALTGWIFKNEKTDDNKFQKKTLAGTEKAKAALEKIMPLIEKYSK